MANSVVKVDSTIIGTSNDDFKGTVLTLQELDTDLFMVPKSWKPLVARGTFGGQMVSQALLAASKTVAPDLILHSMHSYFLRVGDVSIPTIYRVQRTRDGQSFSSRTVSAIQKGKYILTLQASFHNEAAEAPSILQFQPVMPSAKHHGDLLSLNELVKKLLSSDWPSAKEKELLTRSLSDDLPMELKPVNPEFFMRFKANPDHRLLSWVKVTGNLENDQNLQRCAAAFISDWAILGSTMTSDPKVRPTMIASLDHSIWFHKPLKATEWLLYETVCTQMNIGRTHCQGRLWTEDGQLVISVAQEGIIRGKL